MRRRVRAAHDVNDGAVLNIGPIANPNRVDVAADDDVHPDAALLADLHVPDDLGALVDERSRMNVREDGPERAEHAGELYRMLEALDSGLRAWRFGGRVLNYKTRPTSVPKPRA